MVPASFTAFFAASAGAAAALIGLLFVAVSVRPEKVFGQAAERQNTLMASASFTALLNAFFISLGALIPGANLGIFVLVLGPISILNSLVLGVDIFREPARAIALRSLGLVIVALVLYGYEMVNGIGALGHPSDVSPIYNTTGVLMGVYIYGVARAWQLLGGSRLGVLSLVVPWLGRQPKSKDEAAPTSAEPSPSLPVATPVTPGIDPRSDATLHPGR
jgi:hypothetical protein